MAQGWAGYLRALVASGFGKFGQYLITANTTAAYTLDPFRETQSMTPGLRDDLRLDTEDPIMEEIRALPTHTNFWMI